MMPPDSPQEARDHLLLHALLATSRGTLHSRLSRQGLDLHDVFELVFTGQVRLPTTVIQSAGLTLLRTAPDPCWENVRWSLNLDDLRPVHVFTLRKNPDVLSRDVLLIPGTREVIFPMSCVESLMSDEPDLLDNLLWKTMTNLRSLADLKTLYWLFHYLSDAAIAEIWGTEGPSLFREVALTDKSLLLSDIARAVG